jgi:hypothetical protein
LATNEASTILGTERGLMDDELRLLRQAHEEQAKHIVTERVVTADRIRQLERHVKHLEHEVTDAHAKVADAHRFAAEKVADEHEQASLHVDAARAERDAAVRQLEEFEQTRTYRLVMVMRRALSRRPGRPR